MLEVPDLNIQTNFGEPINVLQESSNPSYKALAHQHSVRLLRGFSHENSKPLEITTPSHIV